MIHLIPLEIDIAILAMYRVRKKRTNMTIVETAGIGVESLATVDLCYQHGWILLIT